MKILIIILTLLGPVSLALADVPAAISYQGILTDSLGVPVADDIYAIQFRIYEDSVTTAPLWGSNGFIPKQTTNGLFSHILGSTNPLPDSLSRYDNLWVGITVDLDDEMTPRTVLTSVPFALSAQYSDTASISLNKTVDAGELTAGTLDTARYSAYEDLVSENKIGDGADQVAAGDHLHPGVSGTITRYEDTASTHHNVPYGPSTLLRSLTIPSGNIKNFFRMSFPYSVSPHQAILDIKLNGQVIYNAVLSSYGYVSLTCQTISDSTWFWGAEVFTYDSNTDAVFEIWASGTPDNNSVDIGSWLIEYDVD